MNNQNSLDGAPRWLAAAALLTAAASSFAAKPVPPPSQQLLTDENIVAIVTVAEKSAANQVRVTAEQMLHGEHFTEQTVKLDQATFTEAVPGSRYLLAFSWFTKDPLTRGKGWVKNTAGPEAVGFTEVGNALLPPEPALLALLALSSEPSADAERIDHSLQLLGHSHYKLRYFAALELLLNPRLPAAFSAVQRDQLQQRFAVTDYAPEQRDLMYRIALSLSAELKGEWLAASARQDLQRLGNQYDLASRVPGLAKSATQALRDHGSASDAPLLTDLLRSNAPGVAKVALQALAQHAKPAAEQAVTAALTDPKLPADSRRLFELFRKQGKVPG